MSTPSSAITRFDLSIGYSELDAIANAKRMIGLKVLPPLGLTQEASEFRRIKIASLLTKREDTARAPRAGYKRDTYEWDKDSYATQEHGVEEPIDDAEAEKYGDIIRPEQLATIRLVNRMLTALEDDIATAVFNATTWTGASLTTALATPWTTKATADPFADLDAARDKVQSNSGQQPNSLVLGDKAFTALIRTDRVEGLLKANSLTAAILADAQAQPGLATNPVFMGELCTLLCIDRIVVGKGFKNTADKGQTPSLSGFWNNTMAMLCYVGTDGVSGDLQSPVPQIGRVIFSNKGGEPIPGVDSDGSDSLIFEEYREEQVRGGVLRARNKRQVKIFHKECGHLLTNVTA